MESIHRASGALGMEFRARRLEVHVLFAILNAPGMHVLTHFPQSVHFDGSTTGAENPFCVNAPAGQTLTAGQG
jgi:hypothetical protein